MPSPDVLVRGGGAVGLTAALALARQGFEVALRADAAPAGDDIRAYALNRASVELLRELKVWDEIPPSARTAVHDMHVEGDAPGAAIHFSAWSMALPQLAWIVDAAALEATLAQAARFASRVHRIERDPPGRVALTVIAEGRDAESRRAFGVRVERHEYGHRAIAARLACERPHAGLARQWFRSPDVLALLPMDRLAPDAPDARDDPGGPDRPDAGASGYALVWSLPEARAAELLALDAAAFEAELAAATGGAAGALTLASRRASWPLVLARAEPVCGPGWVLVGDAAHVVHPLAGQGLNLGLADVRSLVDVLVARESWRGIGDEKLLARHARRREAAVRAMGLVTDGLLHLFASPAPLARELRNRGLALVDRLAPIKSLLTRQALGG